MLHTVFLILKISGIILLAAVAILLLVLFSLLFVPVRYEINVTAKEKKEKIKLCCRANWFLHLFSASFNSGENKPCLRVRIFLSELYPPKKRKPEKKDEKKTDKGEKPAKPDICKEKAKENKKADRLKGGGKKKIKKIKCTIRGIYGKIKLIFTEKDKLKDFFADKKHKAALIKAKNELICLARCLFPRKIKGHIRFGMEDPCRTGQLLAILGMLYPLYAQNVTIEPEFDRAVLDGELHIKGSIRMIHLAASFWRLLSDANVRRAYRKLMDTMKIT